MGRRTLAADTRPVVGRCGKLARCSGQPIFRTMGAFLLLKRPESASGERALACLDAQGFGRPRRFETVGWTAYVWGKYSGDAPAWYFHDAANFGFCCGTLFYGGETHAKALQKFAAGRAGEHARILDAQGSFCVVLCRGEHLQVLPDGAGAYKVYHDEAMAVVSSSFLAVLRSVLRPAVNKQSVYAYVFQGATYDGRTVIDQVRLLPPRAILHLDEPPSIMPRPGLRRPAANDGDAGVHVTLIHDELRRSFRSLVACFGNAIDTALSGGYDSRLLLALLREQGIVPRIHVYGGADDPDVVISRTIASGENLRLIHVDKAKTPLPDPERFRSIVAQNFLCFDGYPADGIIDNGADRATRAERSAAGVLALNGGGGEIFRNFFYLPDRSFTVRQLLYAFFAQFDPAVCTSAFVEEEYLESLATAMLRVLDLPHGSGSDLAAPLSRPEIELLYAYFRCSFWMGRNNSVNNRFGYFLTPFVEPKLIDLAVAVPLRLKNHGILEARLIAAADPALAKYDSVYGGPFDRPPSLARLIKDDMTLLRPVTLRRLSYRLQNRIRPKASFHRLLQSDYLASVLDLTFPHMRRYFNIGRIRSGAEMARICTLEYLFARCEPDHS